MDKKLEILSDYLDNAERLLSQGKYCQASTYYAMSKRYAKSHGIVDTAHADRIRAGMLKLQCKQTAP